MRIVSLLASGTELCAALGAGDELVGRSHECDHPTWVARLPALSHPTFDVSGSSAEIDRLVRAKLRAGEPLYRVDEAALEALAPDVVITQTHCEVCAVGPDAFACGAPARGGRTKVATFRGGTLDGLLEDFLAVARAIGRETEGQSLCVRLREQRARWEDQTLAVPRPRVVCLEWIDPLFSMGNWGPELCRLAGGQTPLAAAPGAPSRTVDWEEVRAANPEVLVVAPCGFTLARALAEMPALTARPGWAELHAVKQGRVYVADGNRYFNRSSPSAFATVELLGEILQPSLFRHPTRYEGSAYQRFVG